MKLEGASEEEEGWLVAGLAVGVILVGPEKLEGRGLEKEN